MSDDQSASAAPGRYVALPNGLDMWCQEAGAGPAVVLLHGGASSAAKQSARIPVFAEHYQRQGDGRLKIAVDAYNGDTPAPA